MIQGNAFLDMWNYDKSKKESLKWMTYICVLEKWHAKRIKYNNVTCKMQNIIWGKLQIINMHVKGEKLYNIS